MTTEIDETKINEVKSKIEAAIQFMAKQRSIIATMKASRTNIVHSPDLQEFERYVESVSKTYNDDYNALKAALANDPESVKMCINSIAYELNQFADTRESCKAMKAKLDAGVNYTLPPFNFPDFEEHSKTFFLVFGFLFLIISAIFLIVSFVNISDYTGPRPYWDDVPNIQYYNMAVWKTLVALFFLLLSALVFLKSPPKIEK